MSHPSPVTRPRGPLPARVYWFRRGLVGGLALLLVAALVLLVGSFGGGDQPTGGGRAVTAAAPASPSTSPSTSPSASPSTPPSASATTSPSPSATTRAGAGGKALSASTGLCDPKDVLVRGNPTKVVGGSAVTIPLLLTTSGESCTLAVSSKSVVAKITSGSDRVWSSQDCPAAIPSTAVVVRPADEKATSVDLSWSGRRSEEKCGGGTAWAKPGTYHVITATFGGEQTDQQFTLGTPPRPVVTKTAKPKNKPSPVQTPKG